MGVEEKVHAREKCAREVSVGDTIQKRVGASRLAATNTLRVHGFVAVFGQIR
jgi:hypothetical protein